MTTPEQVLCAKDSIYETNAVLVTCMLRDVRLVRADLPQIALHRDALASGRMLPVGSVEYVREAMRVAGIAEPANLSYHPSIRPLLMREVRGCTVSELLDTGCHSHVFVKPQATKLFTGFVLKADLPLVEYDAHDQEQLKALRAAPGTQPLWVSPIIDFASEWRYYVMDGAIVGHSRYDPDGQDDAPPPDFCFVTAACETAWQVLQHPFALDIGVLNGSGWNLVVELNDAWAIGLYNDGAESLSSADYLRFLFSRWESLHKEMQ